MTDWRFRRISLGDDDQKHFFTMVRLHEDTSDFESSNIDLTVTLEQRTWKGEGEAPNLHPPPCRTVSGPSNISHDRGSAKAE